MPPAFVLSQDQTLMFIPGGLSQSTASGHPPWLHDERPLFKGRQTLEPPAWPCLAAPPHRPCANVSDTHAAASGLLIDIVGRGRDAAYRPIARQRQRLFRAPD